MPCFSRVCTVATTFLSRGSRRPCFGRGRQRVVVIILFKMAELPGTLSGIISPGCRCGALCSTLLHAIRVCVRFLILSATPGWNA